MMILLLTYDVWQCLSDGSRCILLLAWSEPLEPCRYWRLRWPAAVGDAHRRGECMFTTRHTAACRRVGRFGLVTSPALLMQLGTVNTMQVTTDAKADHGLRASIFWWRGIYIANCCINVIFSLCKCRTNVVFPLVNYDFMLKNGRLFCHWRYYLNAVQAGIHTSQLWQPADPDASEIKRIMLSSGRHFTRPTASHVRV